MNRNSRNDKDGGDNRNERKPRTRTYHARGSSIKKMISSPLFGIQGASKSQDSGAAPGREHPRPKKSPRRKPTFKYSEFAKKRGGGPKPPTKSHPAPKAPSKNQVKIPPL